MKDVITNKQGHCPYCDFENNISYDNEYFGDSVKDYYTCENCDEYYSEEFRLFYKETVGDRQIEE